MKFAPRFCVTYSVVTPESAWGGSDAHSGYLPRSGEVPLYRDNLPKNPARFTLAQVADMLAASTVPIEADSSPCSVPRWVSGCFPRNESIYERQDAQDAVTLSVHLGEISDASARRVARLLNCRGIRVPSV